MVEKGPSDSRAQILERIQAADGRRKDISLFIPIGEDDDGLVDIIEVGIEQPDPEKMLELQFSIASNEQVGQVIVRFVRDMLPTYLVHPETREPLFDDPRGMDAYNTILKYPPGFKVLRDYAISWFGEAARAGAAKKSQDRKKGKRHKKKQRSHSSGSGSTSRSGSVSPDPGTPA